tara:strand:+ start:337 stop:1326 length:990 start_codon:yes stop_codon:yes gene_type:complete
MNDTFTALRVHRTDGKNQAKLENLTNDDLPSGNVLVDIHYSTINYKDALAVTGKAPIIREYPRIAGIDLSGEVLESDDKRFIPGQKVASLNGGLGETRDGGYAERTRINAEKLQPLPNNMSTRTAMALGTAGATAALAIYRMEQNGQHPGLGPILVTGATGGVGSIAIDLLSNRGYETVALSGKPEQSPFLKSLGATSVIDRQELELESKPLGRATWGGAIDNLGGDVLSWLTRTTRPRGNIASIGLAASTDLQTTVLPFILRGVSLIGAALECYPDLLDVLWEKLANDMAPSHLDTIITQEVTLQNLPECFDAYIDSAITGRTLVKIK